MAGLWWAGKEVKELLVLWFPSALGTCGHVGGLQSLHSLLLPAAAQLHAVLGAGVSSCPLTQTSSFTNAFLAPVSGCGLSLDIIPDLQISKMALRDTSGPP